MSTDSYIDYLKMIVAIDCVPPDGLVGWRACQNNDSITSGQRMLSPKKRDCHVAAMRGSHQRRYFTQPAHLWGIHRLCLPLGEGWDVSPPSLPSAIPWDRFAIRKRHLTPLGMRPFKELRFWILALHSVFTIIWSIWCQSVPYLAKSINI